MSERPRPLAPPNPKLPTVFVSEARCHHVWKTKAVLKGGILSQYCAMKYCNVTQEIPIPRGYATEQNMRED